MNKIISQRWLYSLILAVAVLISSAAIIKAETSTTNVNTAASLSAQESVIIENDDSPLERKSKLNRSWVLYNDGTTIWALYAANATACTKPTTGAVCENAQIQKRAIQTLNFFTAWDANFRIILVSSERMEKFTTGPAITTTDNLTPEMFIKRPYMAHRLIKAINNKAVYLDDGEKLRPIIHEKVFKNNGWDFKDVETVEATEINSRTKGEAVTDSTVFGEEVEIKTTAARKTSEEVKERLGDKMLSKVKTAIIKADGQYFLITKHGKIAIPKEKEQLLSRKLGLDLSSAVEVTTEESAIIPTVKTLSESTTASEVNQPAK